MWSNQNLWNVPYHELVIIARLGKKRKLQGMVVQFIIWSPESAGRPML
jgi:hypothetical protein